MGSVALTASRMDWSEEDTVKTTMNGISNITFIKRRHACRTEVLKNGDGRTDGRTDASSLCLAPGRTDRTRRLLWPNITATDYEPTKMRTNQAVTSLRLTTE